jgi:hypothetical protein
VTVGELKAKLAEAPEHAEVLVRSMLDPEEWVPVTEVNFDTSPAWPGRNNIEVVPVVKVEGEA